MSRPVTPALLSANDLLTGRVVHLGASHNWVTDPQKALLLDDEATAAALLNWAQTQPQSVIAPFLVPVQGTPPAPRRNRDRVRSLGPFTLPRREQRENATKSTTETAHV